MPSKDSCQCLVSGCLFLSGLKPIRTSSSKTSAQLSFKRCGGDQGRLEVNWSMTRRKASKERGVELFYLWSWEGKVCSLSSCVKRIFKKLSGRKKLMKANWKSSGYLEAACGVRTERRGGLPRKGKFSESIFLLGSQHGFSWDLCMLQLCQILPRVCSTPLAPDCCIEWPWALTVLCHFTGCTSKIMLCWKSPLGWRTWRSWIALYIQA